MGGSGSKVGEDLLSLVKESGVDFNCDGKHYREGTSFVLFKRSAGWLPSGEWIEAVEELVGRAVQGVIRVV